MNEFWQSAKEFLPAWIGWAIAFVFVLLGKYGETKDVVEIAGRRFKVPPRSVMPFLIVTSVLAGSFWAFHQVRMERDAARETIKALDSRVEITANVVDVPETGTRVRFTPYPLDDTILIEFVLSIENTSPTAKVIVVADRPKVPSMIDITLLPVNMSLGPGHKELLRVMARLHPSKAPEPHNTNVDQWMQGLEDGTKRLSLKIPLKYWRLDGSPRVTETTEASVLELGLIVHGDRLQVNRRKILGPFPAVVVCADPVNYFEGCEDLQGEPIRP